MEYILEIKGLRKEYPGFTLNDISLGLPRGAIMGLIGPNGAGKTTTIKLILNMVRKNGGEIRAFGLDSVRDEKAVKSRIGFILEYPAFVPYLRAGQAASAWGKVYPSWDEPRFLNIAREFGVPLEKRVHALSRGTLVKLALAGALSHGAELLVLDEPTMGLDPVFRRELLLRLSGLVRGEGASILFSTHITSDIERIADYIAIIHRGSIVYSGEKDEIRENWAVVKGDLRLLAEVPEGLLLGTQKNPYGFKALTRDAGRARRLSREGAVVERISFDDVVFFLDRENGRV